MNSQQQQMDRIEGKIDRIDGRLDTISVVQAEQAKDISHHIRRTDAIEQKIEILQTFIAVGRALVWIGGSAAAALAIVKLWQML